MYAEEVSDRLTGYIVRPVRKLPLRPRSYIAIRIFPEQRKNSEKALTSLDTIESSTMRAIAELPAAGRIWNPPPPAIRVVEKGAIH